MPVARRGGPQLLGQGLVELPRSLQEPTAQVLELLLPQQDLLAHAGVVVLDRLQRLVEPPVGLGPGPGEPRGVDPLALPGRGEAHRRHEERRPPRPSPPSGAAAPTAGPARRTARARPRPARRPASARRPRPGPGARRSGPRARAPSPSGRPPPAPGRSPGRAAAAAGTRPAAPRGAPRRRRRPRTAAGRSAGSRAWPPGCRRRWPGPSWSRSPRGLLGAHVGRRAQRRAGQRLGRAAGRGRASASARPTSAPGSARPSGLGQAPVDHQRLAVLADDDVARLDVAVQHAPAVGVLDRVADVEEPPQQLAQLQRPPAGVASSAPRRRGSARWPP